MREYVVLPKSIVDKPREPAKWIAKALEQASLLEPKAKKK
jgi:hypothetical protein